MIVSKSKSSFAEIKSTRIFGPNNIMVLETSGEMIGRTIGRVVRPVSERPTANLITQKNYPVKIA
jgi:hypothetical protein